MMVRFLILASLLLASSIVADEITLAPSKDNSLFEEGELSNGIGTFLFAGNTADRNAGAGRRGLLAFDIAGNIPAGATIDSATLTLNLSKNPPGPFEVETSLHKLVSDWGEGQSKARGAEGRGIDAEAGDATWTKAFAPDTGWNTPGGDFIAEASAATTVNRTGKYDWSSAGMVGDIQSWLDSPELNFGWAILGDETRSRSARRFDSREHGNESNRPSLVINFTVGNNSLPGDFNGDQILDAADIDALAAAIRNQNSDSQFDVNGDGLVNPADHTHWVVELRKTYFGDSNLDGEFGSTDFIAVFGLGEYEDDIPGNSTWASGDWNGDADFNTNDFVAAFADGGFEQGPRAAVAVPEPASCILLGIGLLVGWGRRQRRA